MILNNKGNVPQITYKEVNFQDVIDLGSMQKQAGLLLSHQTL
jgi:hypothetical protein